MRKSRIRIIIIIVVAVGVYIRHRRNLSKVDQNKSSTIDALINAGSGDKTSGDVNIDVDINAGGLNYEGGGEYATFSTATLQSARDANKRIIFIFERAGDPTGDALHEDIVKREARIPKNTIIFFTNIETEAGIANTLQVDKANTIVYINSRGEEIRRIGNGVITLSQIVNGIDGLITK